MHRQTENMNTYAWRRTIYSMPGKLIPWWQLPIDQAIGWKIRNWRDNAVEFVVCMQYEEVASLVTPLKATLLAEQVDNVVTNKKADEILRQYQAIADRTSPH